MIWLRRSLVGFVAICLAFAAGVAIGNGPLQGTTPVHDDVSLAQAKADYQAQLRELEQSQAFGQALGTAASQALLSDQLKNTSVALFVLPGVRGSTVLDVSQAVTDAGGDLVITGHLTRALIDPARKTYVDSVATNSMKGLHDLAGSTALPTYGRIGALIARAYTGAGDALAVDPEANRIDAQLQGAKLVTLHGPLDRRASAVIVLASGDHGTTDEVYARQQIQLQVTNAMAATCDGLLVSAPAAASEPGGLIATVVDAEPLANAVTTLNVLDSEAGRIATVGALAAATQGQPGNYGTVDGKVVLPPALSGTG